jgi:hypothetical protein
MIASLPTQEQVDRVARDLAPDVVRIRLNVRDDWPDHPALYFRVILSDEASGPDRLLDVTRRVRQKLYEDLQLAELEYFPHYRYRSRSELAELRDPAWD